MRHPAAPRTTLLEPLQGGGGGGVGGGKVCWGAAAKGQRARGVGAGLSWWAEGVRASCDFVRGWVEGGGGRDANVE